MTGKNVKRFFTGRRQDWECFFFLDLSFVSASVSVIHVSEIVCPIPGIREPNYRFRFSRNENKVLLAKSYAMLANS